MEGAGEEAAGAVAEGDNEHSQHGRAAPEPGEPEVCLLYTSSLPLHSTYTRSERGKKAYRNMRLEKTIYRTKPVDFKLLR